MLALAILVAALDASLKPPIAALIPVAHLEVGSLTLSEDIQGIGFIQGRPPSPLVSRDDPLMPFQSFARHRLFSVGESSNQDDSTHSISDSN